MVYNHFHQNKNGQMNNLHLLYHLCGLDKKVTFDDI